MKGIFPYIWALGAIVTGVLVIFATALNFRMAATIMELPVWSRIAWGLIFGFAGFLAAHGLRRRLATMEISGLVLLSACSLVIAIGRLPDRDPVGVVASATAIGLFARALVISISKEYS